MARGTFTEGRLESFERMMQSVPGRMKDYEPPRQQRKKEMLRQPGCSVEQRRNAATRRRHQKQK